MRGLPLHGAGPEALYATFGVPMPARVIDFSTNASVLPWPDGLDVDLPALASRYPDSECRALRRIISEREGLSPRNVLFTNGSNEAIWLLASLMSGARVGIVQPAYTEHARALEACGARVVPLDGIDRAQELDAVSLTSPCNPTGGYVPRERVVHVMGRAPGTLFIVDEAYVDFLLDVEPGPWPRPWPPRLVVLRSLTKIFHLSGLRVGYALASEDMIARMAARQPSWSVSGPAQALARAFLERPCLIDATRAFYRAETPRFVRALADAGWSTRPSDVHFFLIGMHEMDDDLRVVRALLERGIVVRHGRNFTGLGGPCVRVATRLPHEDDALVAALTDILASMPPARGRPA
ncbi:MAG: pyridoxal phosphate-dependent class II aminotransferase [Synergistaceae bacterium]|nr:pyridoxal phosphate-dependent class II aminotransferase [Synergistaceae bacterium]